MAERAERLVDVKQLAWMCQGAMYAALTTFARELLRGAEVDQPTDTDLHQPEPHFDLALNDGWKIRFERTVIAPDGAEYRC